MAESSSKEQATEMGKEKRFDIQELLKNLDLRDSEINDVYLGKEAVASMKQNLRWMAVARVHTLKSFSDVSFREKMESAWGLAREFSFRAVAENLYVLQMFCLGDWLRVTEEGSWLFRQQGVMIEPFDGAVQPETVKLDSLAVWIQIHKIPPLYRNKEVVEDLASLVGKVLNVDLATRSFTGADFVRAS